MVKVLVRYSDAREFRVLGRYGKAKYIGLESMCGTIYRQIYPDVFPDGFYHAVRSKDIFRKPIDCD